MADLAKITLTVAGVMGAIEKVGASLPAFIDLFNQVIDAFSEDDQATLKDALEQARKNADAAHSAAQAAAKGN